MTRYYEDLNTGFTTELSSFEMTAGEIKKFAEQYDPLPIHIDEERAAQSRMGELIASGYHTLASVNRVTTEEFKSELATVAGLGIDDLSWPNPVRPGDVLTPTVEIIELRRVNDGSKRGLIRLEISALNQDGDCVLSHVETGLIAAASSTDS